MSLIIVFFIFFLSPLAVHAGSWSDYIVKLKNNNGGQLIPAPHGGQSATSVGDFLNKVSPKDLGKILNAQDLHELRQIHDAVESSGQMQTLQDKLGGQSGVSTAVGDFTGGHRYGDQGNGDTGYDGTSAERTDALLNGNSGGTPNGTGNTTDNSGSGGAGAGAGASAGAGSGAAGGANAIGRPAAGSAVGTGVVGALKALVFSFGGRIIAPTIPCILVFPPGKAFIVPIIDYVAAPHPLILFYSPTATKLFSVGPPLVVTQQVLGTAVSIPTICFKAGWVPVKGFYMMQVGTSFPAPPVTNPVSIPIPFSIPVI